MKTKDGKDKAMMNETGIPVSRWIDGVLEAKENLGQPNNTRAMVLWGHAPNSQSRLPDMKKAMGKLDLLVVVDPHPTVSAVLHDRKDGVYLLPTTTQFETRGSVTASNRSIQWREQVVDPLFESKPDHIIMKLFADKFGFSDRLFRNIKVEGDEPLIEDITREINRGMWTIGYTGQSPERIKSHMANQHTFDKTTLQAVGGPCDGDFYGMPWPSWGTPEMKHPGTPNLYDMSRPVSKGGLTFRARFGVERNGENLLAEGVYSQGSEIKDGYPEFTMQMLMDLGWDKDLTAKERAAIKKVAGAKTNWKTDLSVVSSVSRLSTSVPRLVTRKHGQSSGTSQILCHCTASLSTQAAGIWSRIIRPTKTVLRIDCLHCMHRSRKTTSRRTSRSS